METTTGVAVTKEKAKVLANDIRDLLEVSEQDQYIDTGEAIDMLRAAADLLDRLSGQPIEA